MRLEHVFRAAVLSVSVQCDEDALSLDASFDASLDASAPDARDASYAFVTDSNIPRCEAGDPTFVDACGGCCVFVQEHCEISPDDRANDAGALWNCDRYCPNVGPNAAPWACIMVDADIVNCFCTGRRFEGYEPIRGPALSEMARLEAASVFAFARMHDELVALGASPRLLKRVVRAMNDEKRHTRMMTRLARRRGQRVERVRAPQFSERDAERIAIENATEGCVRELFGALAATWHATHAHDPELRDTFRIIARDETRHAELALRVAAFLSSRLDATARRRVANARIRAVRQLRREVGRGPFAHELLFEKVFGSFDAN